MAGPRMHPMEGDGLSLNLYKMLWKQRKNCNESCQDVLLPDTVVYHHNYPTDWFVSSKVGPAKQSCASSLRTLYEVKKRQSRDLDSLKIFAAFTAGQPPPGPQEVVACYLSKAGTTRTGESITGAEFFTPLDLREFLLNRAEKRDGILQRFMKSKGTGNTVVQVIWTPRITVLQRKTNDNYINDITKDAYTRAVTYEGRAELPTSSVGMCSKTLTERIKAICGHIVAHFAATDKESKTITRMVLYFKVDKENSIYFLWCGSLRVGDPSSKHGQRDLPLLELNPVFISPAEVAALRLRSGSQPPHVVKVEEVHEESDENVAEAEEIAKRMRGEWMVSEEAVALIQRKEAAQLLADDMLYTAFSAFRSNTLTQDVVLTVGGEMKRLLGGPVPFRTFASALGLTEHADGTASRLLSQGEGCVLPQLLRASNAFLSRHFSQLEVDARSRALPQLELALVGHILNRWQAKVGRGKSSTYGQDLPVPGSFLPGCHGSGDRQPEESGSAPIGQQL